MCSLNATEEEETTGTPFVDASDSKLPTLGRVSHRVSYRVSSLQNFNLAWYPEPPKADDVSVFLGSQLSELGLGPLEDVDRFQQTRSPAQTHKGTMTICLAMPLHQH